MIDLEIGVIGSVAPELKTRLLLRDRFVGICRAGHPLLTKRGVTAERYASYQHVVVSRKPRFYGPVDDALGQLGLRRTIVMVALTYSNALQIVRHSDILGLVPFSYLGNASTSGGTISLGIQHFELPVQTPEIKIAAIWHPRLHADPAHLWLRTTIFNVCKNAYP